MNTFTGVMNVAAGILSISHGSALSSTQAGTVVAAGASLELQNNITVGAEGLTLNGTGFNNTGALRNLSGNNIYGGTVTLNTPAVTIRSDANSTMTLSNAVSVIGAGKALTVDGAGTTIISGAINTTTGTVTKNGTGTLLLSGASTFTGLVTVNEGVLSISSTNGLGTVAGGVSVTTGSGIAGSLQLQNNIVVGAEALTIRGAGHLGGGALRNLSGNNTWGGVVTVGAGGATITAASGTLTLDVAGTTPVAVINGSAALTFDGAGNIVVPDIIALTTVGGTITKTGVGTLTLSGNNNYAGATTISNGIVHVTSLNALGSTTAGTTVLAGGSLEMESTNTLGIVGEALTLNGAGFNGTGALRSVAGDNNYTATVLLGCRCAHPDGCRHLDPECGDRGQRRGPHAHGRRRGRHGHQRRGHQRRCRQGRRRHAHAERREHLHRRHDRQWWRARREYARRQRRGQQHRRRALARQIWCSTAAPCATPAPRPPRIVSSVSAPTAAPWIPRAPVRSR